MVEQQTVPANTTPGLEQLDTVIGAIKRKQARYVEANKAGLLDEAVALAMETS